MARRLRLSVVEQSPFRRGGTGAAPLRESVVLPHYSALEVAENFRMLEAPEELQLLEHSGLRASVGDPAQVAAELDELAELYATDPLGTAARGALQDQLTCGAWARTGR